MIEMFDVSERNIRRILNARIEELEAENANLKAKLVEALLRIPCPYDDGEYEYDEFHRERDAAIAKLTGGKDG